MLAFLLVDESPWQASSNSQFDCFQNSNIWKFLDSWKLFIQFQLIIQWVRKYYLTCILIWKYESSSCQELLLQGIAQSHEFTNHVITVLQNVGRYWPAFNKGDCESMAYINQKLSNTLESFVGALQNTSNDSCECRLMLENIQRRLQM